MAAVIVSKLYTSPVGPQVGPTETGISRNDLQKGYRVVCESLNVATTYSWSLVFTPDSPGPTAASGNDFTGTPSTAGLLPPEGSTSATCKFDVDWDGSYLIRLITDAGTVDEDSQFIRLRLMTTFGDLKLIAAGERRDQGGVVPVDAATEGWSDVQNQNIQRLMLMVRRGMTTGRTLYVDPNRGRTFLTSQASDDTTNIVRVPGPDSAARDESGMRMSAVGCGDFSSISEAISYASAAVARGEPALAAGDPYIINVAPGTYNEDLALVPFVYLMGAGGYYNRVTTVDATTTGSHTFTATGPGDLCVLIGMHLTNSLVTTGAVLENNGGILILQDVAVQQEGVSGTQGPALHVDQAFESTVWADQCLLSSEGSPATQYALVLENLAGAVTFTGGMIVGPSAVFCLSDPVAGASTLAVDIRSAVITAGVGGTAYQGYPSSTTFATSEIGGPVVLSSGAYGVGAYTHDVELELNAVSFDVALLVAPVSVTPTGTTGSCTFNHGDVVVRGATAGDYLDVPTAPGNVPTVEPSSQSYANYFDNNFTNPLTTLSLNSLQQIPVGNVQEALTLLTRYVLPVTGAPFYSLESAYNGLASLNPPVAGDGLGRTIEAGAGAVQITAALAPVVPYEPLLLGGLQVEGQVDIGPLMGDGLGSEFTVDPNTFGMGVILKMGRNVFPNVTGLNSLALVQVGSDPSLPFDYTVHTRNSAGLLLRPGAASLVAGSGVGALGPGGGDVHLQAGSAGNPAPTTGSVWVAPGAHTVTNGRLELADPSTATAPTLLAAGPFVPGPATGTFYIQTINGVEEHTILAADTIGTLVARINTTSLSLAATAVMGTTLRLTGLNTGPTAFILYMTDDQGGALNTMMGDLVPPAATYVAGSYVNHVGLSCIGANLFHVHGTVSADVPIIAVPGGYQPMLNPGALVGPGIAIVGVDNTAGTVTVTLPVAPAVATQLTVKHEAGVLAPLTPVNIVPGAANIDGVAGPRVYNNPLDHQFSLTMYFSGAAGWFII